MPDFLLEIGTEELPASAVYEGMEQLEERAPVLLERERLRFEDLRAMGTPRRLVLEVKGLPEAAGDTVVRKKGPPLSAAKSEDGSWSKAAVGFARSQGIEPDALEIGETEKGSYLFAVSRKAGRPAVTVLAGLLPELVGSLRFSKSMRWGNGEERFSRPVRWLLAMFGSDVVEFAFAGLRSSNTSQGHRQLSCGTVEVGSPGDYQAALERAFVVVDHLRRRRAIVGSAERLCSENDMIPVIDEGVLAEVVQMVEWPGVVLGRFDKKFLTLPREVLVHAMQSHQRYFPVEDGKGNISDGFLAVHNGDRNSEDLIRKGHERVLAARLSDARFFYAEDLKLPLEQRAGELEHVVYQSELGSMAEKSKRLAWLTGTICEQLGLDPETRGRAERAAVLAKCDLVTNMVVEFPQLQGTMGRIYALASGEEETVARAIGELYLPRRPGDALPSTTEGAVLSLADKMDNLAASFGLGHHPTGSVDPYGLRRQVVGALLIMLEREYYLSVALLVREAARRIEAEAHGFTWDEKAEAAFKEFFSARERVFFTDRGYRYDLVEAVLALDWDRPASAAARLDALAEAREAGVLSKLFTA